MDAELLALSDTIPVDDNKGTAVKIKTATIATKLVGIHVNAAALVGCCSNELDAGTKLSKLMVAAAGVANDVDTIQSKIDVRTAGGP
jgi:hypothetical protein